MSRKFNNHRFFLFETSINNSDHILRSIINPLFIVKTNSSICIHTNRDVEYSFEYTKSDKKIEKRLLLVAAKSNLDYCSHLNNIDNVIKTNTLDKNIYRPIVDFIHTIDNENPIIKYDNFSFGFSFNLLNNNNYLASIPFFTFDDSLFLVEKLENE